MRILRFAVLLFALLVFGSETIQAQSFTYNTIRKDYVFDDGFGIPHSITVSKRGRVSIAQEDVTIEGAVYRRNEKGVYKNARGKSVDLSYSYQGDKLVAVRISTGHIINNYLLEPAVPEESVIVQK